MDNLAIPPRTLLRRTRWGTATVHGRRQGLLAREAAGRWRAVSPEELRRGCQEGFVAWLRRARRRRPGTGTAEAGVRREVGTRGSFPGPGTTRAAVPGPSLVPTREIKVDGEG